MGIIIGIILILVSIFVSGFTGILIFLIGAQIIISGSDDKENECGDSI